MSLTHPKIKDVIRTAAMLVVVVAVGVLWIMGSISALGNRTNLPIMYQGRLTDSTFIPITDVARNVKFAIYDAASGGSCVWATGPSTGAANCSAIGAVSTAVSGGLFSVALGNAGTNNPEMLLNSNTGLFYLEVIVDNENPAGTYETLTPRKQLGSSLYSLGADLLDGLNAADFANLAGQASGQLLQGGTAASETLTLSSTANATKGKIYLGSALASAFDEAAGFLGLGTASPVSLLSVGSGSLFRVSGTGDLTRIKNIVYSWPSSQGGSDTFLSNNGSGTLSWATVSSAMSALTAAAAANTIANGNNAQIWNWALTTADKIGFIFGESSASTATGAPAVLSASTLSASTAVPLFVKNLGAALSFRVDDVASDTTPFVIDASGNTGIGTASPNEQLELTENLRLPATTATVGIIKSGVNTLLHTFGVSNIFAGVGAGNLATTGSQNTAIGANALSANTTASFNTAVGFEALRDNTTATSNTAIGRAVLRLTTTGGGNTAVGLQAMLNNTTGGNNTAVGTNSLLNSNSTDNVAVGRQSLNANTSGVKNVALGNDAGLLATTGSNNITLGHQAGDNITTGSSNIVLGYDIDAPVATDSNQMTIGNLIFGTGLTSTGTTVSTGKVGIGVNAPNEQLELTGNFRLPATTTTVGIIKSAANTLLHTFGTNSFFAGVNAGNLTQSGTGGNTGVGASAVSSVTTGASNTGVGFQAVTAATTGQNNTAVGYQALSVVSTGFENTALGQRALQNVTGSGNIGVGFQAVSGSTTGSANYGIGRLALSGVTSGNNNMGFGFRAGDNITSGANNIVIGVDIDAPSAVLSNQMTIGNLIYGTGVDGTSTTVSTGKVGIGISGPAEQLQITGNFRFPATTATTGIINQGGVRFVHSFGGASNLFAGFAAGNLTMTGTSNIGIGQSALLSVTSGTGNLGMGVGTLQLITTATDNVAIGHGVLGGATGNENVAVGDLALSTNTGSQNTAVGHKALQVNTSGTQNVSVGRESMLANTTGNTNVAVGWRALQSNTNTSDNVAVGDSAGQLSTGPRNTYIGSQAGGSNATGGSNNIVIGYGVTLQTASGSGLLNIGNYIFGSSITATGTTISTGRLGLGVILPAEKLEIAGGLRFGSSPNTQTTVSDNPLTIGAVTINVASTTGYPSAGTLLIESEAMTYTGTTATTFTGVARGVLGTSAASHAQNTVVNNYLMTANAQTTTPKFVITGDGKVGIGTTTPGEKLDVTGNLRLNTIGNKMIIKEGVNASMGTATLVGGTVTVSNTLVTASSRIMLTPQNSSGTPGSVYISARTAATSFTITSTDGGDTRDVAWMIIEPAP